MPGLTLLLYALLIAFVVLSALDVWSTVRVLRAGGREANPVMAWLIGRLGMWAGLIAPKILVIVALLIALRLLAPGAELGLVFGLGMVNLGMVLVLTNNLAAYRKQIWRG